MENNYTLEELKNMDDIVREAVILKLEVAAKLQDDDACILLGDIYSKAVGVERNPKKGYEYYLSAADRGNSQAMAKVAWMLMIGQPGLRGNVRRAAKYAKASAREHCPDGYFVLGLMYRTLRVGKCETYEECMNSAFQCFYEAAKLKHVQAERYVASHYLNGYGVKQDFDEGMKYLMRAIKHGDSSACIDYAEMLVKGEGVEVNVPLAIKYYEQGIKDGHQTCTYHYHLARCYLMIEHPNVKRAKELLEFAASWGEKDAIKLLKTLD